MKKVGWITLKQVSTRHPFYGDENLSGIQVNWCVHDTKKKALHCLDDNDCWDVIGVKRITYYA